MKMKNHKQLQFTQTLFQSIAEWPTSFFYAKTIINVQKKVHALAIKVYGISFMIEN